MDSISVVEQGIDIFKTLLLSESWKIIQQFVPMFHTEIKSAIDINDNIIHIIGNGIGAVK